jgi:hypothetical protein
MACRPGALRGPRSLRDFYTPFGSRLPLVATRESPSRPSGGPGRSRYTPHEVGAPRVAGPRQRTFFARKIDRYAANSLENIFQKCGAFLVVEKYTLTHHVYRAFHHNFTTKTPHAALVFLQNPQQKHHSTSTEKSAEKCAAYFGNICPAGRASCAEGGHSMAFFPSLLNARWWPSRWSGRSALPLAPLQLRAKHAEQAIRLVP